jgi:hypothetical protein
MMLAHPAKGSLTLSTRLKNILCCLLVLVLTTACVSANGESMDLTGGWEVTYLDTADALPDASARWVPLSLAVTRNYQYEHPREPGLGMCLRRKFSFPAGANNSKWMVLSVGNRVIAHKAYLNGTELKDISRIQNEAVNPEDFASLERNPLDILRAADATLTRETHMWDIPALFLIPPKTLKRENVLQILAWDSDAYNEYLKKVELRPLAASDMIFPIVYSEATDVKKPAVVVRLRRRVPLSTKVAMHVEVQDFAGKVLRKENQTVVLDKDNTYVKLFAKTPEDYKTVIRFQINGKTAATRWGYYNQPLKTNDKRQYLSLAGIWQYKGFKYNEKSVLPSTNEKEGWHKSYLPGRLVNGPYPRHWRGKHRLVAHRKFRLPAEMKASRIFLYTGLVDQLGEFYVNGKHVGTASMYDSCREIDITDAVNRDGVNRLDILMTDWSAFLKPGVPKPKDGVARAPIRSSLSGNALRITMGIDGDIGILAAPETRLQRVWLDASPLKKTFTARAWVKSVSPQAEGNVSVRYTLRDQNGTCLKTQSDEIALASKGETEIKTHGDFPNVKAWSPWSPHLYVVESELVVDGKVVDRRTDRFGARDLEVRGDQILLNGQPVHLLGAASGLQPFIYPKDAGLIAYLFGELKQRGFTIYRTSTLSVPNIFWNVLDELGYFVNANSSLDDMSRGSIDYTNPELHDNCINEIKSYIRKHFNHPSIFTWDYGNEVLHYNSHSHGLEQQFSRAVKEIKSYDPTRIVTQDGSADFPGAETYNPHYPHCQLLPEERYYLGAKPDEIPADLVKRSGMPVGRFRDRMPFSACPADWRRDKPLIVGEFSWLHENKKPGDTYRFWGEEALKPSSPGRLLEQYPTAAMFATFGRFREEEFKAMRVIGASAAVAWRMPQIATRNVRPILAVYMDLSSRFWADQPIRRRIALFNDSGKPADITVELSWKGQGVKSGTLRRNVSLGQGEQSKFILETPPLGTTTPTDVQAVLRTIHNGRTIEERKQTWHVFPRTWLGQTEGTDVAVFDPTDAAQLLLNKADIPAQTIASLDEIPNVDLLVLGEDLKPELFGKYKEKLDAFVSSGGTVFILRQEAVPTALPLPLVPYQKVVNGQIMVPDYRSHTPLLARNHPLFDGLLPDDFLSWAPYGLVVGRSWRTPIGGNAKVLTGRVPDCATTVEMPLGRGRYIATTLEITPQTLDCEPAAARVLANLVRYAKKPTAPIKKRNDNTLVLSGSKSKSSQLLKEKLRLLADYRTELPDKLEGYGRIILCDFGQSVPPDDWSVPLGAYLKHGGVVFCDGVSVPMAAWLSGLAGVPVETGRHLARRIAKCVPSPLLSGIGDGDLAWMSQTQGHAHLEFNAKTQNDHDVIHADVTISGGESLTLPSGLAVKSCGSGQLIASQLRWTDVPGDSPIRVLSALLTNLGARLEYPAKSAPKKIVKLTGISFRPVDISPACNRSRLDEYKQDKKGGWIDHGDYNLRMLPSGRQQIGGVMYDIPKEKAGKENGCVMLASAVNSLADLAVPGLPEQSRFIPVKQKADEIFFLHTSAYVEEPEGTIAWQYEIRYEGYNKLIPGMDYSVYLQMVPVRINVDVADWIVGDRKPPVPPAWQGATGPGGMVKANLYCQRWVNPHPEKRIESIRVISERKKAIPILLGITLGNKTDNLLPMGEINKLPTFGIIKQDGKTRVAGKRRWAKGWNGTFWEKQTDGEIRLLDAKDSPKDIGKAFRLMSTSGPATAQVWIRQPVSLKPGVIYNLALSYRLDGDAKIRFAYSVKAGAKSSEIVHIYNDPVNREENSTNGIKVLYLPGTYGKLSHFFR